jgi:hypothetical protein
MVKKTQTETTMTQATLSLNKQIINGKVAINVMVKAETMDAESRAICADLGMELVPDVTAKFRKWCFTPEELDAVRNGLVNSGVVSRNQK